MTGIFDRLLLLETVSESADRAVRVTVSGGRPPVVGLVGAVGRYAAGPLGSAIADVATDALVRHYAAVLDVVDDEGLLPDPDADTPGARRRARIAAAVAEERVVVDSPAGLVTVELTGDRRVGVWVAPGALRTIGVTDARLAAEATAALAAARAELTVRMAAVHRRAHRDDVAAAGTGAGA